jgi:hypothetical protein
MSQGLHSKFEHQLWVPARREGFRRRQRPPIAIVVSWTHSNGGTHDRRDAGIPLAGDSGLRSSRHRDGPTVQDAVTMPPSTRVPTRQLTSDAGQIQPCWLNIESSSSTQIVKPHIRLRTVQLPPGMSSWLLPARTRLLRWLSRLHVNDTQGNHDGVSRKIGETVAVVKPSGALRVRRNGTQILHLDPERTRLSEDQVGLG